MTLRILDPTRHECLACGSSCHGHRVRLLDGEADVVATAASLLGVPDPVDGPWLRHDDGRCVFLGREGRCRIHSLLGMAAKPRLCQQYPWLALRVADEQRVGLDPGCREGWRTWRSGTEAEPGALVARELSGDADDVRAEGALIACSQQAWATFAACVAFLATGRAGPGATWPDGFIRRVRARLAVPDVEALLRREDTGGPVREALLPVIAKAAACPDDAGHLPALPEESDAWAREVWRRVLFLRLFHPLPPPAAALLVAVGVAAIADLDARPEAFGPRLALWTRAARAVPFWRTILGEPGETLRLIRGDPP